MKHHVVGPTIIVGSTLLIAALTEVPGVGVAVLATGGLARTSTAPREAVDGPVDIGDGQTLYLRCAGEGSPLILLEAGDESGADEWSQVFPALASQTRTCAYDRAGIGRSSDAVGCRGLDEVLDDLDALIDAAGLEGPYLPVGTSGGGFIMAGFAARHPSEVAGMALLETPKAITVSTLPPDVVEMIGCDSPTNVERRDYIAVEHEAWDARARLGEFPMTIVSNSYGPNAPAGDEQTNVADQRGWLVLSPHSRQVIVTSGHSVVENEPELVVDEILAVLAASRRSSPSAWQPTLEGRWVTEPGGPSVHYACYGSGSPAIVLEAGTDTGGSQAYTGSFLEPLATRTMTCIYDRLGTGRSDAPTEPARSLDDTRAVLEGLLGFIELPAPYLLVGQSGGGNFHIDFAAHHPNDVAGLVLIEAYHDDPEAMAAWQAEEGFSWTDNPEHVDWLDGSIRLDELSLPVGDFPVLVLSATQADSGNVENQAYWLGISPDSEQVLLEGSHDLHSDDPHAVTAQILDLLDHAALVDEASRERSSASQEPMTSGMALPGTVYFMTTSGNDESTVWSLVAGEQTQLTQPGQFSGVALSPNHQLLVGMPGSDAGSPLRGATFDVRNRVVTPLEVPDPSLNLIPSAWSPDGTRILYMGWDDGDLERTGIYIADYPSGANLHAVTLRPGNLQDEPIAFSPDGTHVLFYRAARPDPDPHLDGSLWVVPTDGGEPWKISGEVEPYDAASWSPDGTSIVFATTRLQPTGAVWTVAPDGSRLRKVFEDPEGRFPLTPTWSPDGSQILFALNPGNDDWLHEANDLFVIDADGDNLQQVRVDAGFKRFFTWVEEGRVHAPAGNWTQVLR